MRILIFNSDYKCFLDWLYTQEQPDLKKRPYREQLKARNESLFGIADFYSSNLAKLGCEAYDIHFNNRIMQLAWAKEYLSRNIFLRLRYEGPKWLCNMLAAQVDYYKPDIIINHDLGLSTDFLKHIKRKVRLLIGQYAAPLPKFGDFGVYDIILSSLPNLVSRFKKQGIKSRFFPLGFEASILDGLKLYTDTIPISFVGTISKYHASRIEWLEKICSQIDVYIAGQGINNLPRESAIAQSSKGNAWGQKMYQILISSKITLNHHIDLSDGYANNMRLFEATGVGALLITDWKSNLHEMFEVGKEVAVYRSAEECIELIRYYLEHEQERETIAYSGQRRTLKEHTYYNRMQELLDIVKKYPKAN